MKKILLLLKKNILILALVAVVAVIAGGIFKIKKMKQEITDIEEIIKTTYGQLKSYHKDAENAPSPQLTKHLEKEKINNEKLFEIILTKFSTAYPQPPAYKVYPALEFKEYLYFTQESLRKKARRRNVLIPTSFGFPETGLQPPNEIAVLSLKLEVIKMLVELVVDSGVHVLSSLTAGVPQDVAFYKVIPLQLVISGRSVEIVRFLKYLDNPSSFFTLEGISITKGQHNLFNAAMNINAVMLKDSEEKRTQEAQQPEKESN